MKNRLLIVALAIVAFAQTSYADILPVGQKAIPVCAYFTNTESMLNQLAIYGLELAPSGNTIGLSKFIKDECFRPGYKFNSYYIYGVTAAHDKTLNMSNYNPQTDMETYLPDLQIKMGEITVPTDSKLTQVKNAYKILGLNAETKKLELEYVQKEEYNEGSSTPVITSNPETSGGNVFTDVAPGSTYYDALKYLKEQKIVKGYDDGSFKPNQTINRAELTKIIAGAVASTEELNNCAAFYTSQSSYEVKLFNDVVFAMVGGNEPAWFFNYVCIGKHSGFIGGYPDGSFKPAQDINFVESAKIITLALKITTQTTDPWYKGYVYALAGKNAIPQSIATFNQKITRGEMAEMIYRLKANVTTKASKTYSDLN